MYTYIVLGAGKQGLAIAYDLGKFCEAKKITVADYDLKLAKAGAQRVNKLLKKKLCVPGRADAGKKADLKRLFRDADAVVSAVPYHFNYGVAKAAVAAGANFCDLGGNTDVVKQELSLDKAAKKAGVTLVPDTGLMPGMGNTLAVHAMNVMDRVDELHLRCGGLPQKPKGPLG